MEQSLQRIEAALVRIDAAAARLGPVKADSELERKHADLRAEVSATLRDLDRLIDGLEP
ncbi:hypothetical protein G6N82_02015 [Altererythrobacter sp. BO-6]|uniref:hypothetical protein n=1 Tax=Altererythrobacter sp. BO-6 TaxID=2604537 RepID=UPI0013E1087C|nr:hypothetical protein [Altererythrobacter sp. BO-6]QIG53093.1 hypothetical protein G6N82_02015 [Altererythrobacter sp. BO-6]